MEKETSNHYKEQRCYREELIKNRLHGDGKIIDRFYVDRGHPNGGEIHALTSKGIIIVFNAKSGKLVTKLIARPAQIKRYYKSVGREPPKRIIELAVLRKDLKYNK